jgi:hypothetical protein
MDETGYIAHQRRSSKASSLVLLGGRNKKAPGKALVCVWLGGEGGIRTHGTLQYA